MRRSFWHCLSVLALVACSTPAGRTVETTQGMPATATEDWRETWAYITGMQAVVYGYPAVKNATARYGMIERPTGQTDMPLNTFFHSRRASDHTDKLHSSVIPDLLYSGAWFDLSGGPVVITVPGSGDTYLNVQFMEMYSDIFAYLGTQQNGREAGSYLIVGPGWEGGPPEGIAGLVRSPGPVGFVLMRVGFSDRRNLDDAHRLQDATKLVRFAKWKTGDETAETARDVIDPATPANSPLPFFATLNRAMTESPPPTADTPLLSQFASVGIGPGKSDDFSSLDVATKRGLQRAMVDGQAFLKKVSIAGGDTKIVNNWAYGQMNWGRTATTHDYLTRSATQSLSGMMEHWVEEVVKLRAHRDGDGQLLDGSKATYKIRFSREQIPVARAFWSLAVYNDEYDLVENPIGRYSVGSIDKDLKFDPDGGLTLHLQADRPEGEAGANWLPVPRGPFNLFLRAYLPGQDLIDQSYVPPPVRRAP